VPETIDMNTCGAGALLTERSKRGSIGRPCTAGISMRNGGSSAWSGIAPGGALRLADGSGSCALISGSTLVSRGGG
jgi:hypothetical protein